MKIESAFFCDDVRQETNGKLIFIGAYSQDIILQSFPSNLMLHLIICAKIGSAGPLKMEVEGTLNRQKIMGGELEMQIGKAGFGFLPIPIPTLATAAGKLAVRIRESGERWKDAAEIEIKQNIAASPPPQPTSPTV